MPEPSRSAADQNRPPTSELAELFAGLGVGPALLADHTPNTHGDCRCCSLPQGGPVKAPCTLAGIAAAAAEYSGNRSTDAVTRPEIPALQR